MRAAAAGDLDEGVGAEHQAMAHVRQGAAQHGAQRRHAIPAPPQLLA